MFSQMEGLVVGEGISLADLKGTLLAFARDMFGPKSRVRFRPASFRTPSRARKSTSAAGSATAPAAPCASRPDGSRSADREWCIPPCSKPSATIAERYTGFAWGIGIERVAILRYRVEDIRLFYENDLRFLEQFPY
jgi:phenylalanyl-tRNA synthetase alpha chain